MSFNIVVDPSALKELKKIKKGVPHVFSHIVKAINALAQILTMESLFKAIRRDVIPLERAITVSSMKFI